MRLVLVLAVGSIAAGCSQSAPPGPSIRPYLHAELTTVHQELNHASLYPGALEPKYGNLVHLENPSDVAQGELFTVIDSEWQGTLDELTKTVARKIGYSVSANGEKPGSPIYVSVNRHGLPAIALLREAYGQGKGRALLTIDQARRHMTVNYARPEQSPVPHLDDTQL